jgi:hypothetical protein
MFPVSSYSTLSLLRYQRDMCLIGIVITRYIVANDILVLREYCKSQYSSFCQIDSAHNDLSSKARDEQNDSSILQRMIVMQHLLNIQIPISQ